MIDTNKKLNALMRFSTLVQQYPGLVLLTGYLAGQVERLHFVKDATGASVLIRLMARRFPLISKPPYMAQVNGVSIPDPVSLIQVLHDNTDPLAVQLDLDPSELEWYEEVVVSNIHVAHREEESTANESSELQQEIDHVLDIYNECRKILDDLQHAEEEHDVERVKQIKYFLNMARNDMRRLSMRLTELAQQTESGAQ